MRIRHLHFVGIRNLDGLESDLPRKNDTDLIVVHGGPATGKTTFLDTLAAAKERMSDGGAFDARWDGLAAPGAPTAKVTIDWELSPDEQNRMAVSDSLLSGEVILGGSGRGPVDYPLALRGILSDPGDAVRGSVHYLHDGRELEGALPYGADETAFRQRMMIRNAKFGNLYDILDQGALASARSLANERFAELCPNLRIDGLKRFGTSFGPMIREVRGESRTTEKMSTSEKQAYLMALYTARSPIVDSLILLDAPEIGFGDVGAVSFVRALLRWTSRTQLVVATASDAVCQMPETAHVVELRR